MIELQHISKTIGKRKILDDITLSFPDCGVVRIRGENGSGKTTLFQILSLSDKDFSGDLILDGKNCKSLTPGEIGSIRAEGISYVRQKDNYVSFLSMEENGNLDKILAKEGSFSRKGKKEESASEGEALLSVMKRELVRGKKLYLLDETLNHLDSKNRSEVFDRIQELSKSSLVLYIGHDSTKNIPTEMEIVMEKGKIISSSLPSPSRKEMMEETIPVRKKKFSKKLFSSYFRKKGPVFSLFFLLFSFLFGCFFFPVEAASYPYGDMLRKDAEIGSAFRIYETPEEWNHPYSFQSLGDIVFSSSVPDDGLVHLSEEVKLRKKGVFSVNGRDLELAYQYDSELPFYGCFLNPDSYLQLRKEAEPALLTLECPIPYTGFEDTGGGYGIFYFGNKALLEKKYGRKIEAEAKDGTFLVFGRETESHVTFSSRLSQGTSMPDYSSLFPDGVSLFDLPGADYGEDGISSGCVLLSDDDFGRLSSSCLDPNSLLFFMEDEEKQKEYCRDIAKERIVPSFYGPLLSAGKGKNHLDTNYATMLSLSRKEIPETVLTYLLSLIFSLFLVFLYAYLGRIQDQNDGRILSQKGVTKKGLLLYPLLLLLILEIGSGVLGYPFGILLWGAMDPSLFGYFPAPTLLSFLAGVLLILLDALFYVFLFYRGKRKEY